ncbi:right-handed parallel beta-helix repeat-containing protein, partial [Haloferax profundi]|uniref:right-handed parallel beta-helix repeat-containing protein n=1 Tax=Haloferax profundi TaxID=1544718 RepID=UPI000AA62B0B
NDTVENVTIQNVTVTDWNQAVSVRHAEDVAVRNVTLVHNAFGMEVKQSGRVNLTQSTVRDNLVGVYEDRGGDEMILTGTVFEENYAGDVVSDTDRPRRQNPDLGTNRSRLLLG